MFKIKLILNIIINKIKKSILSVIPSHIKALYYLTDYDIKSIKSISDTDMNSDNNYYIIHIWNNCILKTKYYFIKSKNICDIFNIKSSEYLKYIDTRYYYDIIEKYIKNNNKHAIFHIEYLKKERKELYKYKDSLQLKDIDNKSILLLNNVCDIVSKSKKINNKLSPSSDTLNNIMILDYDFNEIKLH